MGFKEWGRAAAIAAALSASEGHKPSADTEKSANVTTSAESKQSRKDCVDGMCVIDLENGNDRASVLVEVKKFLDVVKREKASKEWDILKEDFQGELKEMQTRNMQLFEGDPELQGLNRELNELVNL